MSDLVKRLRNPFKVTGEDAAEAADRIERLEQVLRDIATGQVIELPFIQAIARAELEDRT